jgi:predicted DNA binding protein
MSMGKTGIKAVVEMKTSDAEIVVVDEHDCAIAGKILESGAIVTSALITDGKVSWTLLCQHDSLKKILDFLDEVNVKHELVYKAKLTNTRSNDLTAKEYEILRLALERGFFDYPKKIRLEELAKLLGISKSTTSELLRRAIKKVIEEYIEM